MLRSLQGNNMMGMDGYNTTLVKTAWTGKQEAQNRGKVHAYISWKKYNRSLSLNIPQELKSEINDNALQVCCGTLSCNAISLCAHLTLNMVHIYHH